MTILTVRESELPKFATSSADPLQVEAILKPGCRFNNRLYSRVILSYRGF